MTNKFIIGLITGIALTFAVGLVIKKAAFCPLSQKPSNDIVVSMTGASLSRTELEKNLGDRLIPVESEQYDVLSEGMNKWLEKQLLEKEATAKNITVREIYAKEIWNKSVSPSDPEELKFEKYELAKKDYLNNLHSKYQVKIFLKKPASYVAGFENKRAPAAKNAPTAKNPAQALPPAVKFTDLAGRPAMGPENAPITIVEFSDFHCPFCKRVGPTLDQLMKAYPGKIRRVWRHYPLPFHAGADRTHAASECANEQGKFWQYHDKIFETQGGSRDDAALTQIAQQVGLDQNKFQTCLTSNKYKDLIAQEIAKGSQMGVNGTPAFFVNGRLLSGAQPYESFVNAVEVALDPSKAAELMPEAAPAKPDQPAPPKPVTNVEFNDLKGRPSMGPENAAITLVEFSDFHCPFCKRVEPTIDQLMKNYAGKIRKVWRHYPLPFHTGADRTHAASECAHEQGKFWDYHDKLIETLGASRDDATLIQIAEEVKLDKNKFQQCLTSGKYLELVKKEIAKGSEVGVRGTPAVFVNGQLVSGAQPYESFDKIIQSKLSEKK